MSPTNPVPGGTIGRVDQGVDISAPPGTPVLSIAPSVFIGKIANWFRGQPYEWFKATSGNLAGKYWYAAEQIDFANLTPGQQVAEGQPIGTIAKTGTGTEFGYATASGATEARATTGYREGQATPSGRAFRSDVLGKTRPRTIIVTASMFGGPGDPGTGVTGYKGDNLNQHPDSFAELSRNPAAHDFSALGGLSYDTPVTVTNVANGKSMTLYKRDVGAGGAGINGKPRAIDIWYQSAQQLGLNGLGLVKVTFQPAGSDATGISRPGGESPSPASDPTGLLSSWKDVLNTPRTAPTPGNPREAFQWFLNSFNGKWGN